MKPVYWSKVVNPLGLLNPLLWDQLEEVEVPGDQLEELFAKAAPKKVQPKEEKEEEVQKSRGVYLFRKPNFQLSHILA